MPFAEPEPSSVIVTMYQVVPSFVRTEPLFTLIRCPADEAIYQSNRVSVSNPYPIVLVQSYRPKTPLSDDKIVFGLIQTFQLWACVRTSGLKAPPKSDTLVVPL